MLKDFVYFYLPLLLFSLYFISLSLFSTYSKMIAYQFSDVNRNFNFSSSVWCKNGLKDSKSILFGIKNSELKRLTLTTVQKHNKFYMNITLVSSSHFNYPSAFPKVINKGLLLSRFKHDNIMHVFHDDLIPLFFTLEEICQSFIKECPLTDLDLIFSDEYTEGPFLKYYQLFTHSIPIFLNQLKGNNPLCFKDLKVGLNTESLWFQYGFNEPQGALKSYITGNDMERFTSFVTNKLKLSCSSMSKTEVVFLSRVLNRRILNEDMVIKMVKDVYSSFNRQVEVVKMDLVTNDVDTIIRKVLCSDLLIGMHGSAMILSIFLRKFSSIIELFPYAIQADHVSFIKAYTNIRGVNYAYESWHNIYKQHTLSHPDFPPSLGGIQHLPLDKQRSIKDMKNIHAVHCCNDPAYLFKMYQDTWVPEEFKNVVEQSLTKSLKKTVKNDFMIDEWLFPAPVSNLSAQYDYKINAIKLSWSRPFNVPKNFDVLYNVYIIESGKAKNFTMSFVTNNTFLNIQSNVSSPLGNLNLKTTFKTWILCELQRNHLQSVDTYSEFHFTVP